MAGSRLLHRWRRFRRRTQRFVLHNVLHADDPPHRLALGVAIGVFITFTPTIGFQMALVVFFAWLFRANKVVGVPLVWITNPATIVPIYYPCYVVGRVLLGHESIGWEWWMELTKPPVEGWWPTVQFYWGRTVEIAAPLWLGCVVVAGLLAIMSYAGVYYSVRAFRLRRWGQLTPPKSRRAKLKGQKTEAVKTSGETPPADNPNADKVIAGKSAVEKSALQRRAVDLRRGA